MSILFSRVYFVGEYILVRHMLLSTVKVMLIVGYPLRQAWGFTSMKLCTRRKLNVYQEIIDFKVQCSHRAFANYYIQNKCCYWSDWSFAQRKTCTARSNLREISPKFYMETRLNISGSNTKFIIRNVFFKNFGLLMGKH